MSPRVTTPFWDRDTYLNSPLTIVPPCSNIILLFPFTQYLPCLFYQSNVSDPSSVPWKLFKARKHTTCASLLVLTGFVLHCLHREMPQLLLKYSLFYFQVTWPSSPFAGVLLTGVFFRKCSWISRMELHLPKSLWCVPSQVTCHPYELLGSCRWKRLRGSRCK